MHKFLPPYKFEVALDTPLGRSCVATDDIEEGEIICKMSGPIITTKELLEKYDNENDSCSPLQIGEDIYVDLKFPFVCFNHSCNPNAGIRNNGILFSLRKIKKNEEIFYDYSTTVDDLLWEMHCKCNDINCHKLIGDFQSLPHSRKEFYLAKGALTDHILKVYY